MISSLDGGGSERQTLMLLQWLDRQRFAPELYLLHRRGVLLDQVPDNVPIHAFDDWHQPSSQPDLPSRWFARLSARLPGAIYRRQVAHLRWLLQQRQIDVVYDRTFHMTLIAAPAAAAMGIPRVSTLVSPPSHAVPLHAGRFLAMKRRRLRRAYQQAAAVVAVSRATAADAAAYHRLPRSRIQVIPNPVDTDQLDRQVRETPPPPRDDHFTVVCVGRLSSEKGQDELIAAIAWLNRDAASEDRWHLWLVGDGPCRAALQQQVHESGLVGDVVFWGHQPSAAAWIAAADALCLPSHFEGFPNVVLEAMALGTPVISRAIAAIDGLSRGSDTDDSRGLDCLWTFSRGDDQPSGRQLAKKLIQLRCNSTATRSKLSAGRRLTRQSLTARRVVGQLETLLQRAARPNLDP